jgi:hypothetical protein
MNRGLSSGPQLQEVTMLVSMYDPKFVEMTYEARLQEREHDRLVEVAKARHKGSGEGLVSGLDKVLVAVSLGLQAGHWPFATR